MPHWLIKSGVQRVISWLPNSAWWNALFQKYVTRSIVLTSQQLSDKILEGRRYYQLFQQCAPAGRRELRVMEIGTGYYPTIPLALFLCGAAEVWTYDIAPLIERGRLTKMLAMLAELEAGGWLAQQLPGYQPERWKQLQDARPSLATETPEAWLQRLNIHVLVQDARKTGLPAGSVDLIFSSGVLEYIPRPILREILQECRRVSAPDAAMVHRLNLVDQFSYFDKSLTPFNYLKFTERQWARFNSPMIWQNRLRISDYRALLGETGFHLVSEESTSGRRADLERVKLAPQFQHYSAEELLVLHSVLAAVPAGPAAAQVPAP